MDRVGYVIWEGKPRNTEDFLMEQIAFVYACWFEGSEMLHSAMNALFERAKTIDEQ